jgi:membrane-anchored protein YejM (alkaline phosphatase superfamily)
VFLVPDGFRADMLRPELAPTIHALGKRSDVMTSARHYSTGHVSEAGIFGLLYSLRAHAFHSFVAARVPSYPIEVLRRNGYHTFFISSSRLNPYPTDQLIRMFDEVVFPANDDEALADFSRFVARRREDGRPYFVLAFLYTPHYPFTSAKPHLRRYPDIGPKARTNYLNDVIQADEYVRQSLAVLEDARDSAIVLVTSDHGEEIRDHGVFGHASATFWNEKVQVPFLLRLPGLQRDAARRRTTLSSHTDVWPTIFDHLGLAQRHDPVTYSDGHSLLGPARARPVVVTGRFFPFADRPSAVVDGERRVKTWFRVERVASGGQLCFEPTRITDLDDRPLNPDSGTAAAQADAFLQVQSGFWRFLRYEGPQTAPCAADRFPE